MAGKRFAEIRFLNGKDEIELNDTIFVVETIEVERRAEIAGNPSVMKVTVSHPVSGKCSSFSVLSDEEFRVHRAVQADHEGRIRIG